MGLPKCEQSVLQQNCGKTVSSVFRKTFITSCIVTFNVFFLEMNVIRKALQIVLETARE